MVVCYFRAWARVESGPLKDVVKTHVVKELSPKLCPTWSSASRQSVWQLFKEPRFKPCSNPEIAHYCSVVSRKAEILTCGWVIVVGEYPGVCNCGGGCVVITWHNKKHDFSGINCIFLAPWQRVWNADRNWKWLLFKVNDLTVWCWEACAHSDLLTKACLRLDSARWHTVEYSKRLNQDESSTILCTPIWINLLTPGRGQ